MQTRLKVSSFYQAIAPQQLIKIPNLANSFFLQNAIFVVSEGQPSAIHKYSFESQDEILTIPLPCQIGKNHQVTAIVELSDNTVCFTVEEEEALWVYHNNKLTEVQTHLAPLTSLITHGQRIYTGSKDMTVRLWKATQEGVFPDSQKHALFGHKGQINCLQGSGPFMLSGSSDKKIIVWEGVYLRSQKAFASSVNMITTCDYSNQLAVGQANGTVSIVCGTALRQNKKIIVNRTIEDITIKRLQGLQEIDDSFMWIVGQQELEVCELNVGKVMAKVNHELGKIVAAKCIGSALLLSVAGKGVFIMKF